MKKFVLDSFNLPKLICSHVLGKKHSQKHRRVCGLMIMIVGVFIAEIIGKAAHGLGSFSHLISFICDAAGYGLHGAGLVPFIEISDPVE